MRPVTILLGEDDPVYAEAIERELLAAGYEVRRAGDGVAVLEALREQVPDLLVLDLILPRLRGEVLIAAIKQDPTLRQVPVIVVSGALVERGPAYDLMAAAQVPKGPFEETARDLLAAIASLDGKTRSDRIRRSARALAPRRQVSELLRVTAHYEAVMDSLAHGLLEVDRTGKILWSNSAAERILDTDRSSLIGGNVLDLIPAAREGRLPRLFCEAAEGRHSPQPCYLAAGERTLKIQMVPVPGAEEVPTLTLWLQDLTVETTLDRRKVDLLRYACHEMRGALAPISAALADTLPGQCHPVLSPQRRDPGSGRGAWGRIGHHSPGPGAGDPAGAVGPSVPDVSPGQRAAPGPRRPGPGHLQGYPGRAPGAHLDRGGRAPRGAVPVLPPHPGTPSQVIGLGRELDCISGCRISSSVCPRWHQRCLLSYAEAGGWV